ncbi:hypothetical protein GCM10010191_51550 [Actinomadura vinacea]|uniref:Thioredoxin domain-containing protein n=1 Tax=Actinomadura vinacea TaxID=115336 RepID=A0ABP5WQE0_9ACTN
MSFAEAADLLSWTGLLLLALVAARLGRRVRALEARVPELGLPAGARAPALDRLRVGRDGPALLLFLSSGCGACPVVLDEALSIAAAGTSVPMHAVFPDEALPMRGREHLVQVHTGERSLLADYRVPSTPFAVLVASGRVRRAEPIRSPDVLRELAVPNSP